MVPIKILISQSLFRYNMDNIVGQKIELVLVIDIAASHIKKHFWPTLVASGILSHY